MQLVKEKKNMPKVLYLKKSICFVLIFPGPDAAGQNISGEAIFKEDVHFACRCTKFSRYMAFQ